MFLQAEDGEPFLSVAPDSNVSRETVLVEALAISKRAGIYIRHITTPVPKLWFRTQDGGTATIVFRSGEKPDKLRGGSYAGLTIDEATVVNKEAFELSIATLRFKGQAGRVLLTGTPKGTRHFSFERVMIPAQRENLDRYKPGLLRWFAGNPYIPRPNTKLIQASSRDNPFLHPSFYSNIRGNYSSQLAQQELEGDFIDIAGMMFRREWFGFVDKVPRDCIRVRYIDRAGTDGIINPNASYTSALLMARDRDGRFYIEHVVRGQWSPLERDRVLDEVIRQDTAKYKGEVHLR